MHSNLHTSSLESYPTFQVSVTSQTIPLPLILPFPPLPSSTGMPPPPWTRSPSSTGSARPSLASRPCSPACRPPPRRHRPWPPNWTSLSTPCCHLCKGPRGHSSARQWPTRQGPRTTSPPCRVSASLDFIHKNRRRFKQTKVEALFFAPVVFLRPPDGLAPPSLPNPMPLPSHPVSPPPVCPQPVCVRHVSRPACTDTRKPGSRPISSPACRRPCNTSRRACSTSVRPAPLSPAH